MFFKPLKLKYPVNCNFRFSLSLACGLVLCLSPLSVHAPGSQSIIYNVFLKFVLYSDWLSFSNQPTEFEHLPAEELGLLFKRFFAEGRQKDGSMYSRASLLSMRAVIQSYLVSAPYNRQLNILTDGEFQGVNSLLAGLVKRQRKRGEDVSKKHNPITDDDVRKM